MTYGRAHVPRIGKALNLEDINLSHRLSPQDRESGSLLWSFPILFQEIIGNPLTFNLQGLFVTSRFRFLFLELFFIH